MKGLTVFLAIIIGTSFSHPTLKPLSWGKPPSQGLETGRTVVAVPSRTKTLIVVILDESGSMSAQKSDVIGGFNSFLETQKGVEGDEGRLLLIKFSSGGSGVTVFGAKPLSSVAKLNERTYTPSGGTALYDAVLEGIQIAEETALLDERVLVLIMTDGLENGSRKATAAQVKELIKSHESRGTWTFAYIGENPDGWAQMTGQASTNGVDYNFKHQRQNFDVAASATKNFRAGKEAQKTQGYFTQA